MATMKINARKIPEYVIYLFLWLIFLIIPLVTNNYNIKGGFIKICYDWLRLVPFIIVFVINDFWLLRKLLFKGKTIMYGISLFLTAVLVATSFYFINPVLHKNDPRIIEEKILRDPQWGREDMNPEKGSADRIGPPVSPELFNPGTDNFPGKGKLPVTDQTFYTFLNTLLISLLIAGFNTAIAVTNRWFTEEQRRKEIEKEHIESKLAFLQNQVNPHFLMNTLNNIHSLIEVEQSLAQNAVLKLSDMMRYLLYESGRGTTTLKKEIEFLESYLELMMLRVDKSIKVNLELPKSFNNVNLPPLLFIPFIENAFKHGVSYREPSALSFKLVQRDDQLEFTSVNTISSFISNNKSSNSGGFGLENIKKRLDIIYGNRHKLEIEKTDHEFRIYLIIPT
jgi:hypothetical protein